MLIKNLENLFSIDKKKKKYSTLIWKISNYLWTNQYQKPAGISNCNEHLIFKNRTKIIIKIVNVSSFFFFINYTWKSFLLTIILTKEIIFYFHNFYCSKTILFLYISAQIKWEKKLYTLIYTFIQVIHYYHNY